MGILRGLDSRLLACGCLIGVYETYSGKTLSIVDVRGTGCRDETHRLNCAIAGLRPRSETPKEAENATGCNTP
jgi:hypothetical protein